jgi:transposase
MATLQVRLRELLAMGLLCLARLVLRLEQRVLALEAEKTALLADREQLRRRLQAALRAKKRQAAPFSKGPPKKNPKRPGRKPGAAYGKRGKRPRPEHVDITHEVPVPACCPDCGCTTFHDEQVDEVFEEDIPEVRPKVTLFRLHSASCKGCGKRVRGRHEEQISSATHAAGVHVGPNALAKASQLNKELGLPYGKVARIFDAFFGISITRGGLCQAIQRVSDRVVPTYIEIIEQIRQAPTVTADETGWKVGGYNHWLWAFVSEKHTVYSICRGRGFEEAAGVLGGEYPGVIERDGWAPYRHFTKAGHQTCLNHLLSRCRRLIDTAQRGAARFPHAVQRILQEALGLRDRRDQGLILPHGLAVATGRIRNAMSRLLTGNPQVEENRRFRDHLRREQEASALFTFLVQPGVQATNWRAEHAIRAQVVTRKVCGGNRTDRGAEVHSILASVLRTTSQQGRCFGALLTPILRSPVELVMTELIAGNPSQDPAPP